MKKIYPEYKQLNLPEVNQQILAFWKQEEVFKKSIERRNGSPEFTFYEGPPSANGMPGIHHVMARAIKDIFCRYKTLQGFQVIRKAGWDTHGLPVELQVEKELGITKDDIGVKISIEDYNRECRKAVMKYTDVWNNLTEQMGYWVDMDNPYITYDNKYIESVWWLLSEFYKKGLLYKGYTIQPYSPAAGTGLSTHELNQPGCYRNVKDRTAVAMFEIKEADAQQFTSANLKKSFGKLYILAWTTTPWTLPSNTALAVGKSIDYVAVATYNPFTEQPVTVILAKALMNKYFPEANAHLSLESYVPGASDKKKIPFEIVGEFTGAELEGMYYHQLLPFVQPTDGDAFRVISGDFVTTEDGTGIVHIAPSFGADDFRVAKQNGIGSLTLVDKRGRFLPEVKDGVYLYGEEYVKEAYLTDKEKEAEWLKQKSILESAGKIKELKTYLSVDDRIVLKLQEEGKLFKKETYEHSYPHCWRTDKPVLYYPLDSWFIKTTAIKSKLIELNKQINWKPESTGTGRFANWLENLVDWNLSRSRYWGIPLPIWRTEDCSEEICISSVKELSEKIDESVAAGFMKSNPYALKDGLVDYDSFDLHRPYCDEVILVSPSGKPMYREKDLIDVWFDSGAMPYAQQHYPFENKEAIDEKKAFPADFIAEGVDQTRGWFFTLHVIAAALFDSVAYKTVVSNGLVLDKHGQKMSKRLGNAIDPFDTIKKYGSDAVRWYMISNAQPWDNLKFDTDGIIEVQRKFFGTLFNTYNFYALYANVDGFIYANHPLIPVNERPEFDRWIISKLNALIQLVTSEMDDYEPTKATRAIQDFVTDDLSNWYVRLSRRRFWKGELNTDKLSAYQTLYECLRGVAVMMSPVAPFYAERLYLDLHPGKNESVHIQRFPQFDPTTQDVELMESMSLAQLFSSLILSLRKKQNIRVRQPLQKALIPVDQPVVKERIMRVADLIKSETNIREIEFISMDSDFIRKKAKADFKKLGPKFGKLMKDIAAYVQNMDQQQIVTFERQGSLELVIQNEKVVLTRDDIEIISEDIPGWLVATNGEYTVALDITLTEELIREGIARDLINRLQNIRKERNYELTDRIRVRLKPTAGLTEAVEHNLSYICSEILADKLELQEQLEPDSAVEIELEDNLKTWVEVHRV
ncbi:MAG: isoleucine--tRNA ligase [Flavobacteriales bacterium]|nr:isoleucine--tRNA ligase [Flavobacteriales bacterium]